MSTMDNAYNSYMEARTKRANELCSYLENNLEKESWKKDSPAKAMVKNCLKAKQGILFTTQSVLNAPIIVANKTSEFVHNIYLLLLYLYIMHNTKLSKNCITCKTNYF